MLEFAVSIFYKTSYSISNRIIENLTMRFPYGIADFAALIQEGYFCVDRTDRIPLIENAGKQLLFLRPRRFDKSLWLSTLENYYDKTQR